MLATAAVLVVGTDIGAAETTWYVDDGDVGADAGVIVLTGCLNGCQLLTVITGSSTQTELTTISSQSMMRTGA